MLSLLASVVITSSIAGCGAEERSPQVQFLNSCTAEVRTKFNQAITLLHSFEYPETTRLFKEIAEEDPGCAMAYWGSAMSIWHPLWAPPSRSDLERGAELLAIATELRSTPRESAYIAALRAFYASNDVESHRQRARDYELSMSKVYSNNLEDPEAAMFYALALLASADPRDKSYAQQFRSAGLLNWVRTSQPLHPGVLHYLIHSYDYPGLAHLALDAAMTYAEAAPDSAHAQHMPSHIFTRLGLWDQSLASNHDSTRSASEYTVSAHLPGHYDEGLHSIDYLMYAMLQTARDDEAEILLMQLGEIDRTDTENFKVAFTYASTPARYVLERRLWIEASDLVLLREDFAWNEFPWAQSIHYFARGIGSARSGQPEKARNELTEIENILSRLPDATPPYFQTEVAVQAEAVKSWILLAEGDVDGALSSSSIAADWEDAVDKHPVTPGEVLPARELYADMLFETGNLAQSLEQYQAVLAVSPNRLNSLIGAARAAAALGDPGQAEYYRNSVQKQTVSANGHRVNLDEMLKST